MRTSRWLTVLGLLTWVGWKYRRKVLDKNVLKQVKVGDRVDFTWTEAMIVEVSSPKN